MILFSKEVDKIYMIFVLTMGPCCCEGTHQESQGPPFPGLSHLYTGMRQTGELWDFGF
jgi:hypothetical protein